MKNVEDIYHLTPVQNELLGEAAAAPEARVVQIVWRIGGELDAEVFGRAWEQALTRHTALRTCFLAAQLERPVQVVRQQVRLPFEHHDLSGEESARQQERLRELLLADALRGFDPARPPLFRLTHVRLSGDTHSVALSHHPLLLDGRSAELLLGEALDCYGAAMRGIEWRPETGVPYRAYVNWVERQDRAGAEAYWHGPAVSAAVRASLRSPLGITSGGAGARAASPSVVSRQAVLSPAETEELRDYARRGRLSFETLIAGAWAVVLMREGGRDSVCVGLPAGERPRRLAQAGRIVGLLESVLPLAVSFPQEESVSDWLQEIERRRAGLRRQAHVSRAEVRRWVGAGDSQPLFESAIFFRRMPTVSEGGESGLKVSGVTQNGGAVTCPLMLEATLGGQLSLTSHSGRGPAAGAAGARLLESLQEVLSRLVFPPRLWATSGGAARAAVYRGGAAADGRDAHDGAGNGLGGVTEAAAVPGRGDAAAVNPRHEATNGAPLSHAAAEPAAAGKPLEYSLFYFADDNAVLGEDKYRLYLEGAKFADRHRLAAVWTPERHFHEKAGLYPNPSVLSAALATITEHVGLRAGSVVLPLHHSLRVAEEWSVVDNLSKGRVGLSFTSGWMPNDFAFFPERYGDKREEMFRGIREVQGLWRGEPVPGRDGVGKEIELCIFPKPVQEELPVWLTCSGGPEMFERAGEMGCHVLTALLTQSIEEVAPKIKLYRESLARHGHDPSSKTVTMMMHTFLGEDAQDVLAKVRGPLTNYLKSHLSLIETGAKSLNLQVELSEEEYREKYQDQLAAFAFERYYRTASLIGTPTSCLKMVGRLKEIGVDEVACLIDFGIDVDSVLESLSHLTVLKEMDERLAAAAPGPASAGAVLDARRALTPPETHV
jgi:natural product biosynthesis luciferase-like monooxygenase protein